MEIPILERSPAVHPDWAREQDEDETYIKRIDWPKLQGKEHGANLFLLH